MFQSMKKHLSLILLACMVLGLFAGLGIDQASAAPAAKAAAKAPAVSQAPKYVFYFIGDGLGASQRQITEYFLREKYGNKNLKLLMNQLPVSGINTTYAADTLVTDSAAAGTALATGHKTNNGVISLLPNGKKVKTLMEAAKEKGMGTGLVSTTRITHATPAVFATHHQDRDDENPIAEQYVTAGVDYLAAGGYRHFIPKDSTIGKSKRTDNRDLVGEMKAKGYKAFVTEEDSDKFREYNPKAQDKVLGLFTASHLPYEIDRINRKSKTPSLAELTEKGIELLAKNPKGFFMMVEGGRIDHACHANDAPGAIYDTIAFDQALRKAYDFYKKHPKETLIVVVGDHETGGLGLGLGDNYFLTLKELMGAKVSVEDILNGKGAYTKGTNRAQYFQYLEENLGLKKMTAEEKGEIGKAMDLIDKDTKSDKRRYGGYNQVSIAAAHVLSERANIFWTTYAHSGTAIPMSAIGVGAENFGGYKDNTEIAKAMAKLMGFQLTK